MKIRHRITTTVDAEMQARLRHLGISVNQGSATFEVDESHESWPELQRLISEWQAFDWVQTSFSARELAQAKYLQMGPGWHYGYPQPADDLGYLSVTYDPTSFCPSCRIGKQQVAPFRMKGEPKWGKRRILQMNWVFDEFFVHPEVWEGVFRPFGIGYRPVLQHRTGDELKTVVQLEVAAVSESPLRMDSNHSTEDCPTCGRSRYLPPKRGPFPPLECEPSDEPMFTTQEYFGSGGSAWNAVIVSAGLFTAMKDQDVRGAEFKPLRNDRS